MKSRALYNKPWKHLLASVLAFGLAYGAASWAIDSGRLSTYFVSIVLLIYAVIHLISAIKQGYDRKR